MAGEVGHVVYGARVLEHLEIEMPEVDFWAGTLFPDIKHLGVISRHQTHPKGVSLESLEADNEFETGMRVHAWIDATRNRFYEEASTKETLPWHPFVPHAMKLLEDEYLYKEFDDWNLIQRALTKTYDEEMHYVTSKEHIQRWHTTLQDYFKQQPSAESRYELSLAIGLSENSAEEINTVVVLLKSDERAKRMIDRWVRHLDILLK